MRKRLAQASERGRRELATLYRLLRHPDTPWSVRVVATVAVGYVLSPIQLIPSFIPIIGQVDDVCVVFAGSRIIRMLVDPALLAECADSDAPPPSFQLLAGVAVIGALIALVLRVHMM
jgi:uncharacterized membrane protein YkvA (DUF1232 family)